MENKNFVTLEQAKAFKELGFDWETLAFYDTNEELRASHYADFWNSEPWNEIAAPAISTAIDWLREEKNFLITIESDKESGKFGWVIYGNNSFWKSDIVCEKNGYYVLLLSAIDKAIEILKNNE